MKKTLFNGFYLTCLVVALSCFLTGTLSCSCYTFHVDVRPWNKSRQHCLHNGGDLLSMETEQEWSLINSKIQQRIDMDEWHIGLTNLTGTWKWLSNHPLTIHKWQVGEPELVVYKRYVTMAKNWPRGTQGLFNSLRQDIPRARICEYKRDCNEIAKTCRNLVAKFVPAAIPTPPTPLTTELTFVTSSSFDIKTDIFYVASTSVTPTTALRSSTQETKPFYVVVIAVVLGGVVLIACCVIVIACGWRRKKAAKSQKNELTSSSCDDQAINGDCNMNGIKPLKGFNADQENEDIHELLLKTPTYGVISGQTEACILKRDQEYIKDNELEVEFADTRCDVPSQELQVLGYDKSNRMHINGTSKQPAQYVNGGAVPRLDAKPPLIQPENDSADLNIVKADIVAPIKEAQYASIMTVQTNPKYSKICKRNMPFLTTFAPVYEGNKQNVTNLARKEFPVYATIDRQQQQQEPVYATVHRTLPKKTVPSEECNYAELADFDANAWRYTNKPPSYEQTKYAVVQVPNHTCKHQAVIT